MVVVVFLDVPESERDMDILNRILNEFDPKPVLPDMWLVCELRDITTDAFQNEMPEDELIKQVVLAIIKYKSSL